MSGFVDVTLSDTLYVTQRDLHSEMYSGPGPVVSSAADVNRTSRGAHQLKGGLGRQQRS
jgi:hypothetical protein